MKRTLQTAIAIGRALGAEVEVLEELREISFGDWDGLTHDEVVANYGDLFEKWQGSWELAPPNGESLAEFDTRIRAAKAKLLEKHGGASVVVVAHVMPIRGFLRDALDAGTAGYWRPQISPCSLTAIRLWGDQESEVQTVNYTAHLS
jgi:probable phosphoglycerate mutase